jgi:ubiquinone/menaquinone biosynthesis C-methylase UbiE
MAGPSVPDTVDMTHAVKTHFDRLSSRYDQNFSRRRGGKSFEFGKRAELVDSLVRDSSGALLDCACGTGEISAAALRAGSFSRAVLVDVSGAMLDRAAARPEAMPCVDIEFRESDIFAYQPVSNEEFDVILCLGLIAHTGELSRLLAHLKTMLCRNGRILLQTSVADHLGIRIVRRTLGNRYARRAGYRLSYFTLGDISAASTEAGLVVADIRRYCFGLPFGETLFPFGNYCLERAMAPLAARVGAEAICVLAHRG